MIASAAFCVPLQFLGPPVAVTVPLAALLYIAVLLTFGDIRRNEGRAVLEMFGR